MKLIGKGDYTKAYLRDDGKVELHSIDPVKEVMANGWFPNSSLFPKIEHGSSSGIYIMDYYPYQSSLKNNLEPEEFKLYKALRKLYSPILFKDLKISMYQFWYNRFTLLNNDYIVQTLQDALYACINYSENVYFEISPRNVRAVNGKLLLLDCFFFPKKDNPELFANSNKGE